MANAVKKEMANSNRRNTRVGAENINGTQHAEDDSAEEDGVVVRRVLRSKYLSFKSRISDERDDILGVDSVKFKSIIDEVDTLHQLVQKPREQVADAEALYGIANTLVSSVKACGSDGMTPSDFVSSLLRDFGQQCGTSGSQGQARGLICWKDIGKVISDVFRNTPGCCTMIGPMNTEVKLRKNVVHRKRVRPAENERPEELNGSANKETTDTDKNMAIMFDILRKNGKVKLENLILNRISFSQTVENLFALSFLVKDGRAEISVDQTGCHLVTPRNAPSANAIQSGEASYSHFTFRFDFGDWKFMVISVRAGEELMPHRNQENVTVNTQLDPNVEEAQGAHPTTPIRKLCRNRGLVMQEQALVEDSPESDDTAAAPAAAIRKSKGKHGEIVRNSYRLDAHNANRVSSPIFGIV